MTLAVFAFFRTDDLNTADGAWLARLLAALAQARPQNTIILYTDKPDLVAAHPSSIRVEAQTLAAPWLLGRLRLHRHGQNWLRANRVDALIFFGRPRFTLSAPPFFIVWPDHPEQTKAVKPAVAAATAGILVPAAGMGRLAGLPAQKVFRINGGPLNKEVQPLPPDLLAEKYTGHCAYFMYAGPMADTGALIRLLKAFSRFKRRQKSSFKLVLAATGMEGNAALQEALALYKYRQDVIFLQHPVVLPELVGLIKGAYVFVQPVAADSYGGYLPDAFDAGLPLIALQTDRNQELVREAALYFEAQDEEGLAENLMLLYKDENLHGRLAGTAATLGADFSWQATAEQVWQVVTAAVK